jgi:hypothetical protein
MAPERIQFMKKIYFACSIRGGRDHAESYAELVTTIKQHAEVLTEIFADQKLTSAGMNKPSNDIWTIDMAWITAADGIIAEVTNPSLGVGYEIAKAEDMQKPILCLYRPKEGRKLSAMIDGNPHLSVISYTTSDQAEAAIKAFIASL